MGSIGGQASGDFRLSNSALRILYSLVKDSIPTLASDGFTQSNPAVVTAAGTVSTTLPVNVKKGVLGGSVAFLRPDVGSNVVGGAVVDGGGDFYVGTRPLGLFINDAVGNAYENTPAVASGKDPFLRGGSCGVKIYETQNLSTGADLVYAVGDFLYASQNGLLTNRWQDSLEFAWIDGVSGSGAALAAIEPDVTRMGVVLSPPDATSSELFLALFF
jgi:hypothetical protein